jgi:hypothetical protein
VSEVDLIPEAVAGSDLILRVVVPACGGSTALAACLSSLTAQSEPGWELCKHCELVVVDAPSTLAGPGMRALGAGRVPKGWTAKNHACWMGAQQTAAKWLLFIDPDSLIQAGAVSRAVVEADRYAVQILSYAPLRLLRGLGECLILPLVLSEIANAYPAASVNDPERRLAAADGHFLLIRTDAYTSLGGHEAVAGSAVPEVDLAFLAKRRKHPLRYRYAPEAVHAAAPPGFSAMWQEWTSKLALLIDNSMMLAAWRALDVALVLGLPLLAIHYWWYLPARIGLLLVWLRTLWRIYRRAAKSNATAGNVALSMFGLPIFVVMLVTSWYQVRVFGSGKR